MADNVTLYKCKVKDIPDHIFGQLARLNNGVDGRMLSIILEQSQAYVYYWVQNKEVLSWASVSNDNDWNWTVTKGIKEVNLYTKKGFRKKGYAQETINYIKKDFARHLKKGNLRGHGSCTSLISRCGLSHMD